jgi:hypothetical protein
MNCDKDFNIPYNKTYVKVKPFCESSDVHYKVYLPGGEVKVQPVAQADGSNLWREFSKGETTLAGELGRLIEEQEKEDSVPIDNSTESQS